MNRKSGSKAPLGMTSAIVYPLRGTFSRGDQMHAILYHNPRCSTSRKALELLQSRGLDVEIVEYLTTPPSRETIRELATVSGLGIRGLLRAKEALAEELNLLAENISDAAILDAIIAHPVLLNRPIVKTELGVRLGRPLELIEDVIPPAP